MSSCTCMKGRRCLDCMDRGGLTRESPVRHVRLTLPNPAAIIRRGLRQLGVLKAVS